MRSEPRTVESSAAPVSVHREAPSIDIARTLFSAAAVIATVVLSCIASRVIYSALLLPPTDRSPTPLYGEGLTLPAEPRLEGIEMMSAAGATTSAANDGRLREYGWIDREKRIVHIPIQRAMDLAIERDWLRSSAPNQRQPPKQDDAPKTSAGQNPAK